MKQRVAAAIVFVAMFVMLQGWTHAQGVSDFEALLQDIGSQPAPATATQTMPSESEQSVSQPETTQSELSEPAVAPETMTTEQGEPETTATEEVAPETMPTEESVTPAPEDTAEPDVPKMDTGTEIGEGAAPEMSAGPEEAGEEGASTEPEISVPAIGGTGEEIGAATEEVAEPEVTPPAAVTAPEATTSDFMSDVLPQQPAMQEELVEPAPAIQEVAEPESLEQGEEQQEPVAEKPEEKALPVLPPKPTAEKRKAAQLAAQQEEVRRQAMEAQGLKNVDEGYKLLASGDYAGASKQFEEALKNLIERPQTADARTRARWGYAEAEYRIAADLYRKRERLSDARTSCEKALKVLPEHVGAKTLLAKIARLEEILAQPVPPKKRPDVIAKKQSVQDLLTEGKQYFDIGEYDRAELLFEKVLLEDRYNTDAMRFLKKIEERRTKAADTERATTSASMIRKVKESWNPPVREEVVLPEDVMRGAIVQQKTPAQRLQEKMTRIMIPSIEFRQANIVDVVNFLVEASRAGDEEGTGVNIILNLTTPGQEAGGPAAAPAPMPAGEFGADADIFGEALAPAPAEAQPSAGLRTITLNLRRISLLDAIKYITEVAGLKFRVEDNAVIITPAGVVSGRVITRMYPVQPSILDVIIERGEEKQERTGEFIEMGGASTTIRKGDVKEFFEKAGVPFPAGTSITYNQAISQLIVANTPENLEIFERILANLNVVPNQVEIEARFVEIGEQDLEELGLQWILTDNWEVATKKGSGPISAKERVDILADEKGFTKGLRFFAFDNTTAAIDPASTVTKTVNQSTLGGILSVASVLTNPEMKIILQALAQKGNADLLSAPRITTRSGVNASIAVVREIIYPTEFEVTQPTIQSEGNLVTPPTVTPGSFKTREVGVILNVTPTVGPDGYTIDLTLVPEVAELVDWIQYGSEVSIGQPIQNPLTGLIVGSQQNTFRYNIPQPVFSTRKATTSVVIWDGQTVVMGGLIREELTTFKDKIPLLGDIPILGRLFRSEGQKSRKTNLLIFVTARLVDPAGKPIHKAETTTAMASGAPTPASVAQ